MLSALFWIASRCALGFVAALVGRALAGLGFLVPGLVCALVIVSAPSLVRQTWREVLSWLLWIVPGYILLCDLSSLWLDNRLATDIPWFDHGSVILVAVVAWTVLAPVILFMPPRPRQPAP